MLDQGYLLLNKGKLHDMSENIGERTCTMDILGGPLHTMPNRAMIGYLYRRQEIDTFRMQSMIVLPQRLYQLFILP